MKTSISEKISSLKKHLSALKNRVGMVPERRKLNQKAHQEWLELEIQRTSKKIEDLESK